MLRNKKRGYQQLRVWQDSIEFYRLTSEVFRKTPYELKRVGSQAIAASDSVHRNIAEGYCRRSIREYLQFLNIAIASLGENVSGLHAYHVPDQISDAEFTELNQLAFKIENGLLRLIESLERKKFDCDWVDTLIVKESNHEYEMSKRRGMGPPKTHHSITPMRAYGLPVYLSPEEVGC